MHDCGRVFLAIVCLLMAHQGLSIEPSAVFEGDGLYGLADSEAPSRELSVLSSYVRGQYLFTRITVDGLRDPGMVDEAVGCFREALKVFPGDSDLIGKLSALHAIQSDKDGQLEDFRQMAEANPSHEFSQTMYAEMLGNSGAPDKGLAVIRQYLDREGWSNGMAVGAFLELAKGQGGIAGEREVIRELRENHPESLDLPEVILGVCEFHLAQLKPGQSTRARNKLLEAARAELLRPEALELDASREGSEIFLAKLCRVHAFLNEWRRLYDYLSSPDLPASFKENTNAFIFKCRALLAMNRREELVAELDLYMKRHSRMTIPMMEFFSEAFEQAHELERACQMADALVRAVPDFAGYRVRAALLHMHLGQYAVGRRLLQERQANLDFQGMMLLAELTRLDKDAGAACMYYAQAERLGRLAGEKDKAAVEKLLTIGFYLNYAAALDDAGFPEASLERLALLHRQHPGDESVNNSYGYMLADQGRDLEIASTLIERALEVSPKNIAYLDSLAWVRYRQDRLDEALAVMEQIAGLRSGVFEEEPVLAEHYGDILAAAGRREEAVRYWELAMKDAPRARRQALERKLGRRPAAAGRAFNPYER